MGGYELTERGKILLAVLLVMILLVIPSTIIALKAVAASVPVKNTEPVGETAESPFGSDNRPAEPSGDNAAKPSERPQNTPALASGTPAATPPPETTAEAPALRPDDTPPVTSGPASAARVNLLDGDKLSFVFSPETQTKLDTETEALLDEFLKIPEHLSDYVIIAETRQIPDSAADALMSAVTSAMAERGVPEKQIEHMSFPPVLADNDIEVSMYFVSRWVK